MTAAKLIRVGKLVTYRYTGNMKKLLTLGSCALLLAACSPTGKITGTPQQQAQTLAQIIASGGTAKCAITDLADNSTVEFSVSGKKMKIVGSEFNEGKKGTMINDSTYTYFWAEGEKNGFKTKNPAEGETSENGTTEKDFDTQKQASIYDDETKFKMNCTQGQVSDFEFVPPSDVKFVDPSELQNMSPEELQKLYAPKE